MFMLRLAIGGVMTVATQAIMKPTTYFIACWWMGVDMKKVRKTLVRYIFKVQK